MHKNHQQTIQHHLIVYFNRTLHELIVKFVNDTFKSIASLFGRVANSQITTKLSIMWNAITIAREENLPRDDIIYEFEIVEKKTDLILLRVGSTSVEVMVLMFLCF